MRTSNLAVGVLIPGLHLFSMTPQVDTPIPSSPTMSSPSRSEKLLRDALLRDERERRHRSSPPPPSTPSSHRRRHSGHSLSPTSSCSASTKEDYTCSSSLHADVTIAQLSQQALRSPNYGHHLVQQSQPNTPPSPSSKHFNARKASTQCRAIEGYVSFASVEGLGEPPLVGDDFDGDGRGNGNSENERMKAAAFLPLGVLSAALRWKKFVGGDGPGISHGIEGKDQGVVV